MSSADLPRSFKIGLAIAMSRASTPGQRRQIAARAADLDRLRVISEEAVQEERDRLRDEEVLALTSAPAEILADLHTLLQDLPDALRTRAEIEASAIVQSLRLGNTVGARWRLAALRGWLQRGGHGIETDEIASRRLPFVEQP